MSGNAVTFSEEKVTKKTQAARRMARKENCCFPFHWASINPALMRQWYDRTSPQTARTGTIEPLRMAGIRTVSRVDH